MSNEHENQTGGSPVEESEATPTQVQAAVSRAAVPGEPVLVPPPTVTAESPSDVITEIASATPANVNGTSPDEVVAATVPPEMSGAPAAPLAETLATGTPRVGAIVETPSAAGSPTASEIFAAAAASSSSVRNGTVAVAEGAVADAPSNELTTPVRDGEIRISADHPMATLYMQSPMPPDPRGNRVAGLWISVLAAVVFALVYAGGIAAYLAPIFSPSTYVNEGLLPALVAPSFLVPVVAFLLANVTLSLVVGRSGWWAHIIGSLFVGAITGVAACLALVYESVESFNAVVSYVSQMQFDLATIVLSFVIGVLAREISVWFGAWIGARGRKMTRLNAEALDEYDAALAEVKNSQPVPAATA